MQKKRLFIFLILLFSLLSVGFVYSKTLYKYTGSCPGGFTCSADYLKCEKDGFFSKDEYFCNATHYCAPFYNPDSCTPKGDMGFSCTFNVACKSGFCNDENECDLKPKGFSCLSDKECESNLCTKILATPIGICNTKPLGLSCTKDAECESKFCAYLSPSSLVGKCVDQNNWMGLCKRPNTQDNFQCSSTKESCSSFPVEQRKCASGYFCGLAYTYDQNCILTSPVAEGSSDKCKVYSNLDACIVKNNNGEGCELNTECKSGYCYSNQGQKKCVAGFEDDGEDCISNSDCDSKTCLYNKCTSNNHWVGSCLENSICSNNHDKCLSQPTQAGYKIVQTCGTDFFCFYGLFGYNGGGCVPKKDDNKPCTSDYECKGAGCDGGTCRGMSQPGLPGDFVGSCDFGYKCSDDHSKCIYKTNNPNQPDKICAATNYCLDLIVPENENQNPLATCENTKKPLDEDCSNDYECLTNNCNDENKCSSPEPEEDVTDVCGSTNDYECSDNRGSCLPNNENLPLKVCNTENYCSVNDNVVSCQNLKVGFGVQCAADYECLSNTCEDGLCGGCVSNDDCDNGAICLTEISACQALGVWNCNSDSECNSGEKCVGNTCQQVEICTTTNDCSNGEACFLDVGFGGKCKECDPSTEDCELPCIGTGASTCTADDLGTSCANLGGVLCDMENGYSCINGEDSEQSTELGCCVATEAGNNPGCASPPILLGGKSVRFEKECLGNGQAKITVLNLEDPNCNPLTEDCKLDPEEFLQLGIDALANPYYEQDYSCGGVDFGDPDASERVPAYSLIGILLSLTFIVSFYFFRKFERIK